MSSRITSRGCENCRWSHHEPESRHCSCVCHKNGTAYQLGEYKPEQPHIAGLSIAECECKTCKEARRSTTDYEFRFCKTCNQMTNWERNPEGRNCVKCKKKKED